MRWHWALENKHSFDHTETMENTTYSYTFASLFAYHYIPDVSQRAVETGAFIIVKSTRDSTQCRSCNKELIVQNHNWTINTRLPV